MKKTLYFFVILLIFAGCSGADPVVLDQDDILIDQFEGVKTVPNFWLENITFSAGQLYPSFSYNITNYYSGVDNSVSSITVTPQLADTNAAVSLNGSPLTNQQASGSITLAEGLNRLELTVTAADGVSTLLYGFDFYRAAAGASSNCDLASLECSPSNIAFDAGTLTYSVTNSWEVGTFTITPAVADAGATLFFNGKQVSSGSAQTISPLPYGTTTNTITVVAADFTSKTYSVAVTRQQAAIMSLFITEWADAGSDLDYVELRNFGTRAITIDEDFYLVYGATTVSTKLVKWGTNNTELDWLNVSSTPAVVEPGEVILIVDEDIFNADDGTANFDQLVSWGLPAGTKVFLSEETTLIGANDRLDEGQAHLEWGDAKWSYTPPVEEFSTNVGTSTYSKLKVGFDPATDSSSDTANWENGSSSIKSPGTWN